MKREQSYVFEAKTGKTHDVDAENRRQSYACKASTDMYLYTTASSVVYTQTPSHTNTLSQTDIHIDTNYT